jgi:hypothetical protein
VYSCGERRELDAVAGEFGRFFCEYPPAAIVVNFDLFNTVKARKGNQVMGKCGVILKLSGGGRG